MSKQYSITQPRLFKKQYVISNDAGPLVTLSFPFFDNHKATAQFSGQLWEIKSNFLTNKIQLSSAADTYTFDGSLLSSGGSVEIQGKAYTFKSLFLTSKRTVVWQDDGENELIKFTFGTFGSGLIKLNGQVEVTDNLADKNLGILLTLGLYLYKTNYSSTGTGAH